MFVGICLSGLPRGEYYPEWIKKLADIHECAVFLNYYNYNEDIHSHSNAALHKVAFMEKNFNPSIYKFSNCDTVISSNDWDVVKPKLLEYRDRIDGMYLGDWVNLIAQSMWYSIQQSYKMLCKYEESANRNFDIVIRARMDIFAEKDVKFEFEKLDLRHNVIYTPSWSQLPINDQFALGCKKVMHKYCNMYDYLNNYIPIVSNHPEQLLQYHLVNNGIEIKHWNMLYSNRWNPEKHPSFVYT
jgi:hypothetical protein